MMQDSAIASLVSEVSLFTSPMMPLFVFFSKTFLFPLTHSFLFPFIFKICHLMNCLEYSNEVFGSATCFFNVYFIFVSQF